jgi:hypothetical protein
VSSGIRSKKQEKKVEFRKALLQNLLETFDRWSKEDLTFARSKVYLRYKEIRAGMDHWLFPTVPDFDRHMICDEVWKELKIRRV